MRKSPSSEIGLKKGSWTTEEDRKLIAYVEEHGHGSWRKLPLKAGLQRCGKSCRLRWKNYLRPDIKRGKFTSQEEQTIMQLHALLGNRWSAIATHLPRRTDNEIKNYWNTYLKKRLTKMGIDPVTHKSKIALATNLSHMTQWEKARLEAEARLVRESRLISESYTETHNGSALFITEPLVQPFSEPQPLSLDVPKAWQSVISSKQSDFKETQTHFFTLNFVEKALSSHSNMGNQSMLIRNPFENTQLLPSINITTKDCINYWEILKEPFNISKEENRLNMLEVNHDILHQDNFIMEALTNPLAGHANNGNHGDGFEDNNSYWNQILVKLGNNL